VALPGGLAVSRRAFDAALVTEAAAAGVTVRTGVRATLGELTDTHRTVHVEHDVLAARVVILATGLAGAGPASADSRIGVGVVVPDGPTFYEPGTIYMAVSKHGYVGLVRVEGGGLDVAAAFDPAFVRSCGGPGPAVAAVLDSAGWPGIPDADHRPWKGTPFLTRRPDAIAGERWLAVGDAAGYVEPFTGEGMAWAVASARAVVPFAARAAAVWDDRLIARWTRTHRRRIGRRQWACGIVSRVLRHPVPTRGVLAAISRLPRLARPVVAALNRPITLSPGRPA
jgi:2-polyprenyl-6-methoxyphenol hydroxylase-like FAD-dependent oxidoreductase